MTNLPPDILELRKRGYAGGLIAEHRAFRRVDGRLRISWSALLLVIGLTAAVILLLPLFAQFWRMLLEASAVAIGFPNDIAVRTRTILPFVQVDVPYFATNAPLPGPTTWTVTLIGTLAVVVASLLLPERLLPLAYLLRLAATIQLVSLGYFAVLGQHFPYTLPRYSSDMFTVSLAMLAVIPLIFGLTYFVFDFGLTRKLLIVVLTIAHFLVFIPVQYLLHAAFVKTFSVLYLPVLFMMFGALLDVSVLIAMYGWGMSWRDRAQRVS